MRESSDAIYIILENRSKNLASKNKINVMIKNPKKIQTSCLKYRLPILTKDSVVGSKAAE